MLDNTIWIVMLLFFTLIMNLALFLSKFWTFMFSRLLLSDLFEYLYRIPTLNTAQLIIRVVDRIWRITLGRVKILLFQSLSAASIHFVGHPLNLHTFTCLHTLPSIFQQKLFCQLNELELIFGQKRIRFIFLHSPVKLQFHLIIILLFFFDIACVIRQFIIFTAILIHKYFNIADPTFLRMYVANLINVKWLCLTPTRYRLAYDKLQIFYQFGLVLLDAIAT